MNLRLSHRLLGLLFLLVLVAVGGATITSQRLTRRAIVDQEARKLRSILDSRMEFIDHYFEIIEEIVRNASMRAVIQDNIDDLGRAFDRITRQVDPDRRGSDQAY